MSVQLFKHNQITYDNMAQMFEAEDKVGVVQPTGTGKSFLYLKWIEDHKQESIVVLAPSNEIFNQLAEYASETNDESLLQNIQMITYQTLNNMTPEEIAQVRVDRIIIDEFHRTGATQWGPTLQHLLTANPHAKVLGATATPIRYLDDGKDMADELFEKKLAGYMTLGEAVEKGILPTPTYVPVWYDYDEKLKRYQNDIETIKDAKERAALAAKLYELKKNLQTSYGAEDIFEKYMPTNHGKYIVFCRDYEHLQEMQKLMESWLSKVNSNVRSYVSISREKDKDEQLNAFKNDNNDDAVKLLFTIDRLNEGLHVKGLDGVIMLRPTTSPIIYLQQMGRALAAGSKSPVIFDMVNNYQNVQIPLDDGTSMNAFEKEFRDSSGSFLADTSVEQFKIFEKMARFNELFKHLEDVLYLNNDERWQRNFDLLKEYIKQEGHLPPHKAVYKGTNIGSWLAVQRQSFKFGNLSPERIAALQSVGVNFESPIYEQQWQKNFELLKEYINQEGRSPSQNTVYKGANIGSWLVHQRDTIRNGNISPERIAALQSIGVDLEMLSLGQKWQRNFELLKAYINQKGHLPPHRAVYEGANIGLWLFRQKEAIKTGNLSPEHLSALQSIGVDLESSAYEQLWQRNFELLKEYINQESHLPPHKTVYKGANIGRWIAHQKANFKAGNLSSKHLAALQSIGIIFDTSLANQQWQRNFELLKAYVNENGRLPLKSAVYKDANIGTWLANQKKSFKFGNLSPERIAALQSVGVNFELFSHVQKWQRNFELLKAYIKQEGHLPPHKAVYEDANIGAWLQTQKSAYKSGNLSAERVQALASIGIDFGPSKSEERISLNDMIAAAEKRATTTGAHGDEPFTNVKERLPEKGDFGR